MGEMTTPGQETANRTRRRKPKLGVVVLIVVLAAVVSAGYWWFFMRNRVSTENAYVMADSALIGSRVSGTIERIMVENDDPVEAGTTLITLDPRDYQAEVDKQEAALAYIEAQLQVSQVTVGLTDSRTAAQLQAAEAAVQAAQDKEGEIRHRIDELERVRASAQADLSNSKREFERYANLLKEGAGSEQQRDRTRTVFKKAQAHFEATEAQIAAAKASLSAALQQIDRAKAERDAAKAGRMQVEIEKRKLDALKAKRSETQAQLEKAKLNLSYCTITAPISGYIAQKRIQVGERVQQGQSLLAVIPLHEVYVEANFKETQLKNVRIGQPVEIKADIYPGRTYHGKVAGIRAGTGAAFSLLPPENATGNWIKVVQRVPVKILLDEQPPKQFPLRVGASLDVTVSTADRSGPVLRLVKSKGPVEEARFDK